MVNLIGHSTINWNLAACRRSRVSLLLNRLTDFTARQIEIYLNLINLLPPLKIKGAGGFEEFSGNGVVKGYRADSENSPYPLNKLLFITLLLYSNKIKR